MLASAGFFSSIYLTHADGTSEKVHKSASPEDVFGGKGVVYPDIAALEAKMARLEKVWPIPPTPRQSPPL